MDELFKNLESNNSKLVEESKNELAKAFSQTKENWLVYGMMDYYVSKNSMKIVEILVKVQAPHDNFIFDKLLEWINMGAPKRHQAFAMFWLIAQKHPSWLYKIVSHKLFHEMLRVVRTERYIQNTLHGLFCIIIILPIIPASMIEYLQELFSIFLSLSDWKATNNPPLIDNQPVYLQNGIERLFQRLYGMYPCNFIAYLHDHFRENSIAYTNVIEPLLINVKVHPMLLTSDKESEKICARWKEMEPHDVVNECEKFALDDSTKLNVNDKERNDIQWFRQLSNPNTVSNKIERTENTFAPISSIDSIQTRPRAKSMHNKWDNIWSPSSVVMATPPPGNVSNQTPTPTMMSHGYSIQVRSDDWKSYNISQYSGSGTSPPEAAVEATPETTPLREYIKPQRPYPVNSNAVRKIGVNSSQPSSPMKRDDHFRYPDNTIGMNATSEKILRMMSDRSEIQEQFVGKRFVTDEINHIEIQDPLAVNQNTQNNAESRCKEDEEVTEINKHKIPKVPTTDAQANEKENRSRSSLMKYHDMKSFDESFGESIVDEVLNYRNKRQPSNSALNNDDINITVEEVKVSKNNCTIETQTDITLPIASHGLLEKIVETSLQRQKTYEPNTRTEVELQLLYLQLQYERYRREVYAERNRRLLGKSRDSETYKMDNDKLKFQVEKLSRDHQMLLENYNKSKTGQNFRENELLTESKKLREDIQIQLDTNKKLQQSIESLDRRLAEESEEKKQKDNELKAAQAEIFDLKNLLRQCQYQAEVGSKYKEELQRLRSREVLMGEIKLKCSEKLIELSNLQAKEAETNDMKIAYQNEIKDLKIELGTKTALLDAAKERNQILESQLHREKNIVSDQKRSVQLVKEAYEEKLKAVEAKYSAQKAIILRMEESLLESRHKANANSEPDKSGEYEGFSLFYIQFPTNIYFAFYYYLYFFRHSRISRSCITVINVAGIKRRNVMESKIDCGN